MISETDAMALVTAALSEKDIPEDSLVIDEEATIDTDFGWIFFYNSKKFLETKDFQNRVAGNGPIFVNRRDATIKFCGSGTPLDVLLSEYKKTL